MRVASPYAQNLPLYVHDGFDLNLFSNYVGNRSDFVVEDHHSYYVFTPQDAAESASAHTVDIATGTNTLLADASSRERRNLIVGEWSCALTAQSLSGEVDLDAARTAFCSGQEVVYRNVTAGWAFWCACLDPVAGRAPLTNTQHTVWNLRTQDGHLRLRLDTVCLPRFSPTGTAPLPTPRRLLRSMPSWPRCVSSAVVRLRPAASRRPLSTMLRTKRLAHIAAARVITPVLHITRARATRRTCLRPRVNRPARAQPRRGGTTTFSHRHPTFRRAMTGGPTRMAR
jgi:hypothetical protein